MCTPSKLLTYLLIVPVIFSFHGCASGPRGKLELVEDLTENELRQGWNAYTVYYRRNLALVYKIKDDRKIILDNSWIKVSSEDMMTKSEIVGATWVEEIMGSNDAIFGYLVQLTTDRANVKIIDENTVQLNYHHRATTGH